MAIAGRCAKVLARGSLHQLGLIHALFWRNRDQFLILTYHRFQGSGSADSTDALTQQCEYLRRHFHPVAMSEVGHALRRHRSLPPNAVAVTVDDGYGDFKSQAAAVFEAYGIPVTVYLMTSFVDRQLWPWWDQVAYAIRHTTRRYIEINGANGKPSRRMPMGTPEERETAIACVTYSLTKCCNQRRLALLDRLPEIFETRIPKQVPAEYAPLSWDDARELEAKGVEFGAHTATHPILPLMENRWAIHKEVEGSKLRIEREMHHPVLHFAYPNGDFDEPCLAEVAADHFLTAVTVRSGFNSRDANPYLLRRCSVGVELSQPYFREVLAGFHCVDGWRPPESAALSLA